jgi:hypothetical protein
VEMREGSAKHDLPVVALLLVLSFWGCQGVTVDQAEHARAAYPTKHNCSLVRPSSLDTCSLKGKTLNERVQQNEMFFSSTSSPRECGQCVPGTTGQWRVLGAASDGKVRVRYCPAPQPGYQSPECQARDAVRNPSGYYCGINEYCTEGGQCRALKAAPRYGGECQGGSAVDDCGVGLQCIYHRCTICEEGT